MDQRSNVPMNQAAETEGTAECRRWWCKEPKERNPRSNANSRSNVHWHPGKIRLKTWRVAVKKGGGKCSLWVQRSNVDPRSNVNLSSWGQDAGCKSQSGWRSMEGTNTEGSDFYTESIALECLVMSHQSVRTLEEEKHSQRSNVIQRSNVNLQTACITLHSMGGKHYSFVSFSLLLPPYLFAYKYSHVGSMKGGCFSIHRYSPSWRHLCITLNVLSS